MLDHTPSLYLNPVDPLHILVVKTFAFNLATAFWSAGIEEACREKQQIGTVLTPVD